MTKQKLEIGDVARLMGARVNEIASFDETPAGLRIVHRDGNAYIDVPEDRPDAEGKTGLMYLAAPPTVVNGKAMPYAGLFPVYAQPVGETPITAPAVTEGDDGSA